MEHLNPKRARKLPLKLTTAFLLLSCVGAAAAARALLRTAPAAPASATSAAPDEQGEVELITLRPAGFEPRALTRPGGRFLLVVAKRDLAEEVTLRLFHETGNRLREVKVARAGRRYREVFDLSPGRYVLTTAERPEWVCEITVLPR